MLALVPGRAEAEHGPAAGEHIERGDDLGEQPGMAIGDAGDEQAERIVWVWPARKPSAV